MRQLGNRVRCIALSCIGACVESNPAFDDAGATEASSGSDTDACDVGTICLQDQQTMLFAVDAQDIAVGRIDDDASDDLLLGFEGGAAVLFAQRAGTLPLPMQPLFTAYGVSHVCTADVDLDGDDDAIVTANRSMPDRVDVRRSAGDRSFEELVPLELTAAGDVAKGVAALRIDDDDFLDIALVVEVGAMDNVSVWRANGAAFGNRTTFPVTGPTELLGIPLDDRDMLVVATGDGIVLARFDVAWETETMLMGNDVVALASGHSDDDGLGDVFVGLGSAQQIEVLHNDGSETLVSVANVALDAIPDDLATGDIDGDGHIDAVVAHPTAELTILHGTAMHEFDRTVVPLSSPARAVALADLDDDGRDDVVLALDDGSLVVRRSS